MPDDKLPVSLVHGQSACTGRNQQTESQQASDHTSPDKPCYIHVHREQRKKKVASVICENYNSFILRTHFAKHSSKEMKVGNVIVTQQRSLYMRDIVYVHDNLVLSVPTYTHTHTHTHTHTPCSGQTRC